MTQYASMDGIAVGSLRSTMQDSSLCETVREWAATYNAPFCSGLHRSGHSSLPPHRIQPCRRGRSTRMPNSSPTLRTVLAYAELDPRQLRFVIAPLAVTPQNRPNKLRQRRTADAEDIFASNCSSSNRDFVGRVLHRFQ